MDIDIRKAVIANCSGNNQDQLQDTISDAIQGGEEKTLPGLGVFFELCWNEANESDKEAMLANIEKGIPEQTQKAF
ncbi:MAG TPA: small acid-soluble spore protein SspI [Bacillales bacterium]|nr:small acid-soluble spore protein SspI [Bacillales bacterium]